VETLAIVVDKSSTPGPVGSEIPPAHLTEEGEIRAGRGDREGKYWSVQAALVADRPDLPHGRSLRIMGQVCPTVRVRANSSGVKGGTPQEWISRIVRSLCLAFKLSSTVLSMGGLH
jgi:hypothetical protein